MKSGSGGGGGDPGGRGTPLLLWLSAIHPCAAPPPPPQHTHTHRDTKNGQNDAEACPAHITTCTPHHQRCTKLRLLVVGWVGGLGGRAERGRAVGGGPKEKRRHSTAKPPPHKMVGEETWACGHSRHNRPWELTKQCNISCIESSCLTSAVPNRLGTA